MRLFLTVSGERVLDNIDFKLLEADVSLKLLDAVVSIKLLEVANYHCKLISLKIATKSATF